MAGWFSAVWPVATFFLGGASAYVRDLITENRLVARDRNARDAERQRAITDRRESFELDHLQKLHGALSDLSREAAGMHSADRMAAWEGMPYGAMEFPVGAAESLRLASAAVYSLKGLVLDDYLRGLVMAAHAALTATSGLRDVAVGEADSVFAAGILAVERAQDALAARIREIYLTAEQLRASPPGLR